MAAAERALYRRQANHTTSTRPANIEWRPNPWRGESQRSAHWQMPHACRVASRSGLVPEAPLGSFPHGFFLRRIINSTCFAPTAQSAVDRAESVSLRTTAASGIDSRAHTRCWYRAFQCSTQQHLVTGGPERWVPSGGAALDCREPCGRCHINNTACLQIPGYCRAVVRSTECTVRSLHTAYT